MTAITTDDLKAHALWMRGATAGKRIERVDADLSGANLRGANLSGANLSHAIGIVAPPMGDPRGYRPVAVMHADGWRIASGCRWLTLAEAYEHWDWPHYHSPWLGAQYVHALDWLVAWSSLGVAA